MLLSDLNNNLSRAEKITVLCTLMTLVFVGALFFNNALFETLFGSANGEEITKPIIGRISFMKNDARFKHSSSFTWNAAHLSQAVCLDDSIYTGMNSRAQVRLERENSIDMGANTLIVFSKIQGAQIPNLADGNFRLRVKGEMTLALNGQVTNIKGSDPELQVYIGKDKKPQIKLLKGHAVLKTTHHAAQVLDTQSYFVLDAHLIKRAVAAVPGITTAAIKPTAKPEPEPEPIPMLTPLRDSIEVAYTKHFHDVYGVDKKNNLFLKPELPQTLQLPHVVQWTSRNLEAGHKVLGQLSSDPSFAKDVISFESKTSSAELPKTFVEDNYWRISLDGKNWSPTSSFKIHPQELNVPPVLHLHKSSYVTLKNGVASTELRLTSPLPMKGYVLEASRNPQFPPQERILHWTSKSQTFFRFHEAGSYYYRARAVNAVNEITSYSNVLQVRVQAKPLLQLSTLSIRHDLSKKSRSIAQRTIKNSLSSKKHEDRAPAAVTSSITTLPNDLIKTNQGFSSSKFDLEAGVFNIYSPDEANAGKSDARALSLGFRLHHWFQNTGLEAALRVKASDENQNAKRIKPLFAELRYHYLLQHSSWMQTSLFAGYEIYRNVGTGYYTRNYDLTDLGFSMNFPFKTRWDMGGDVLAGFASDNSRKYQLSGHINYYLQKDWSFGVGYRVYLFEAGSDKTAPIEYPYKEAYGEGFSVLQWHY